MKVYQAIMDASQEIATYLRYHSAHLVKSLNPFGKQQTSIDLKPDEIIANHLIKSGKVFAFMSEERPFVNNVHDQGKFIVSYNPIDGITFLNKKIDGNN